jgi:hypothetical protein
MTADDLAASLAGTGRASLPYTDPFTPDRALMLECYRAPSHTPDRPVVLVQHGMGRNGDEYCEAWVEAADRHGLLIVATTFPNESWPGSRPYNDGHVLEEDGTVRPREAWSHAIPGRVFSFVARGRSDPAAARLSVGALGRRPVRPPGAGDPGFRAI